MPDILDPFERALERASESPFWTLKAVPLVSAQLSVLIPLRDQDLLFTPEGRPEPILTPELIHRYSDLVSLKWLAFTLQQSNEAGELKRTTYDARRARTYRPVPLDALGAYLAGYTIDLDDEMHDFPIAHYNLHTGIGDLILKLMKS